MFSLSPKAGEARPGGKRAINQRKESRRKESEVISEEEGTQGKKRPKVIFVGKGSE